MEDGTTGLEEGRQIRRRLPISYLAGDFVNGLRKALDVARRYPSHGYPAVFGGVYRVLVPVSTVVEPLT